MTTETIEVSTVETLQSLLRNISVLRADSLRELAEQAQRLAENAETPNAETAAAMEELENGGGEFTTVEAIMAELNAKN